MGAFNHTPIAYYSGECSDCEQSLTGTAPKGPQHIWIKCPVCRKPIPCKWESSEAVVNGE